VAQIVIGKIDMDHVSISVLDNSAEWTNGTVRVSVGPWNGSCRVSFYAGELHQFASEIEELYKTLSGIAQLSEPYFEIRLKGDGRGHVLVEGKARHEFSANTCLAFQFEIDQTELPAILKELRKADTIPIRS